MVRVLIKLHDGSEIAMFYRIFDEALRVALQLRNCPNADSVKIYHLDGTEIKYLWFDDNQ